MQKRQMKPATKSARRRAFLARKIADMLFHNDDEGMCARLALVFQEGETSKCAGWCHKAVVMRVKDLLEKYKA